ncbi:MAG: hypothetical protein IT442_12355 [Phycisphaeraceae bacterium]|nr:hypothetical protein [Phycisphaeraceae bacterium]
MSSTAPLTAPGRAPFAENATAAAKAADILSRIWTLTHDIRQFYIDLPPIPRLPDGTRPVEDEVTFDLFEDFLDVTDESRRSAFAQGLPDPLGVMKRDPAAT